MITLIVATRTDRHIGDILTGKLTQVSDIYKKAGPALVKPEQKDGTARHCQWHVVPIYSGVVSVPLHQVEAG